MSVVVAIAKDRHGLGSALNINEPFYMRMPHNMTTIQEQAFYECTGLISIEIPTSVTTVGGSAFAHTGLTSIDIPNTVTYIGQFTFYGCTELTSIEIPNSVVAIGTRAFSGCTGLTSIEIPTSVARIHSEAFSGCTGLTSIEIPTSVTTIWTGVFSQCAGLIAVEIPNSVTSIGSIFRACTNLKFVVAPSRMVERGSEYVCPDCPLRPLVVLSTGETRLRVLREQFWSTSTHSYLSPAKRNIILTVMMAGERMSGVEVPSEMWVAIFQYLRPGEVGKP